MNQSHLPKNRVKVAQFRPNHSQTCTHELARRESFACSALIPYPTTAEPVLSRLSTFKIVFHVDFGNRIGNQSSQIGIRIFYTNHKSVVSECMMRFILERNIVMDLLPVKEVTPYSVRRIQDLIHDCVAFHNAMLCSIIQTNEILDPVLAPKVSTFHIHNLRGNRHDFDHSPSM